MTFPAADHAFTDSRLSNRDRRVYRVAMTELNCGGRFKPFKLSTIAHLSSLDPAHCSRARTRLLKLGYLQRRKADSRRFLWRLAYSLVARTSKQKPA